MDIPLINPPGLRFGMCQVTPELAAKILSKMGRNRRLSQLMVKRYAAGFNPRTAIYQPIILDQSGKVLDGQHRLHAVIAYGKPVRIAITVGVPTASWDDIDQGKTRSLSDVLSGMGVTNCANVAAILALVHRYERTNWDGAYTPNRDSLIDEYSANSATYDEATGYAVNRRDLSVCVTPTQVGFIRFQMGADAPLLDEFWNVIATGAGGRQYSPALQFRNAMITRTVAGRRMTNVARLAMLIKCVNAEIAGEEIRSLRFKANEEMPKLAYSRGELKK